MAAGACYAAGASGPRDHPSRAPLSSCHEPHALHITPLGLLLLILYCLISGLSSVCTELLMKAAAAAAGPSKPLPLLFWCAPEPIGLHAGEWPGPGPPGGLLGLGGTRGAEPGTEWTTHLIGRHETWQQYHPPLCRVLLSSGQRRAVSRPCGFSSPLPSSWPHCSSAWQSPVLCGSRPSPLTTSTLTPDLRLGTTIRAISQC